MSAQAPAAETRRPHPARAPFGWWRGNRRYVLYLLRELSSVAIALWMLVFLVELLRARAGAGYEAFGGPLWIAFSVICLAFALFHTYTFLDLAGLIMRIPLGQRTVPAGLIKAGAFGGFAVASALVLLLVIWGAGR